MKPLKYRKITAMTAPSAYYLVSALATAFALASRIANAITIASSIGKPSSSTSTVNFVPSTLLALCDIAMSWPVSQSVT